MFETIFQQEGYLYKRQNPDTFAVCLKTELISLFQALGRWVPLVIPRVASPLSRSPARFLDCPHCPRAWNRLWADRPPKGEV